MPPPARPGAATSGVERFTIARGAVANMRPLLVAFLAIVGALLATVFALLPALGVALKSALYLGPVGIVALVATLIVYLNLPGRLDLGADGVLVDSRGDKRYIPFSELEEAAPFVEQALGKTLIGVSLKLRSGDAVKVPMGEDLFGAGERTARLSARIREALEAYRRREEGDDASSLARGDRSAEAWRERLQSIGAGANAGPRDAPIPVDRLLRIVEDPSAEAQLRAGAAVALRASLDGEGKQRLRIAAEATASPGLRVVLESAVEGDDEAVAAALSEMEKEG